MKNKLTLLLCLAISFSVANAQTVPERVAKTIMRMYPDGPSENGKQIARWTYDQGVMLKGIEGVWDLTGDAQYFNYIQNSMDFFLQGSDGKTINTYKQDDYNIDNVMPGRSMMMLYEVTLNRKYFNAATLLRSQMLTHPRTSEGGFWHKKRYPSQMWLDGLYMAQPFLAEYAAMYHEDTLYNDIARQFILMDKYAYDTKTGLLYHAWDESRNEKWANKQTGLSANFWGRSVGWYGMALVDALEWFPKNHPQYPQLINILTRWADGVVKYQDPKSNVWYQVLDKGTEKGNYLEASASSMFVYALAKAVRLEFLSPKYYSTAKKGYDGIMKEFVEINAYGGIDLKKCCQVAGLGGKPYRDGSYEYYLSEPIITNDPKGIAAFQMAANEMEIAAKPKPGKGKTVVLDNYFNNEYKQDVTGTTISTHYLWNERQNGGTSLWKFAFNTYGAKTATLKEAPTAENLKDKSVYIMIDPDTDRETAKPNYMNETSAQNIYNWVKAGGVLVMMMNDSVNCEFKHFNTLSEKFGIHFNQNFRNAVPKDQFDMGTLAVGAKNPIFKTAKNFYIKEICTMNVKAPAKAFYTDKGDVIIATAKVGKGTVFAIGDPWLYNEYTNGRRLPLKYENYKAMNDLSKWLLEQSKK